MYIFRYIEKRDWLVPSKEMCGWYTLETWYVAAREDKGDREGIPHKHPIP